VKLQFRVDKATFLFIIITWNAIVTYASTALHVSAPVLTLTTTIGNAAIVLLGVETGNEPEPTPTPSPTPTPTPT
jgi:hypothetical protein